MPERGESMPTISSTLKMFDGMTGPLKSIMNSMNLVIRTFETMQDVTERNANVGKALAVAKKQIASAEAEIHKQIELSNKAQQKFNRSIQQGHANMQGMLGSAKNLLATYLSFRGARALMGTSDEYVNTLARLDIVNDGLQTTAELQEKIFAAADRARGSYSDMAGVIGRLGILAKHAFQSNDELIAFAELMQKSFRVGGTSTMEQQAGMYQLSQAMAAGRLQGDEFRSIMENASMLAQAIARFTGKSVGELKEMSAEGTITADIIKGAMFAAADEINQKFASMPRTFGDVANQIKNAALKHFGPAIQRISQMLNDPNTAKGIEGIGRAFAAAAVGAVWLLNAVGRVSSFIYTNWPMIEPIVWGIVAAFGAWLIMTRAQAVAKGILAARTAIMTGAIIAQTAATQGLTAAWRMLNAAQKANVFLLLISAITALVLWLVHLWKTNDKFAAALMRTWNGILNFFDYIPGYFWMFVEWLLEPFVAWAEKVGKIYDTVINGIIKGINKVLELVNKVTGSSYELEATFSMENVMKGIQDFAEGKKTAAFENAARRAAEREQKVVDFLEARAAKRAQKEAERAVQTAAGFDFSKWQTKPNIGKVDEVGKIRDTVDISSEDLKMMRELAEMKSIQNFVSLRPSVRVQTGPISKEVDIDTVIARIEEKVNEQIASSAKGVFRLD